MVHRLTHLLSYWSSAECSAVWCRDAPRCDDAGSRVLSAFPECTFAPSLRIMSRLRRELLGVRRRPPWKNHYKVKPWNISIHICFLTSPESTRTRCVSRKQREASRSARNFRSAATPQFRVGFASPSKRHDVDVARTSLHSWCRFPCVSRGELFRSFLWNDWEEKEGELVENLNGFCGDFESKKKGFVRKLRQLRLRTDKFWQALKESWWKAELK